MPAKLHHVKKARKHHGKTVRRGMSYFWFKFPRRPRVVSLTKPRRSALTQSAFLGALWDAEDSLGEVANDGDFAALAEACRASADSVRELGQGCEESLANMPESLQNGPTGELLRERVEACERIADELDAAANAVSNLGEVEEPPQDEDDSEENGEATTTWGEARAEVEQVDWSCE